jgi:hypothetical protein
MPHRQIIQFIPDALREDLGQLSFTKDGLQWENHAK